MSNMEIDSVLAQIRSIAAQPDGAGGDRRSRRGAGAAAGAPASVDNGFANVLKQGLDAVNADAEQGRTRSPRIRDAASRASSCRR